MRPALRKRDVREKNKRDCPDLLKAVFELLQLCPVNHFSVYVTDTKESL